MSDFETAVADSKKLTSKPSNDDLLELYGMLFPQLWRIKGCEIGVNADFGFAQDSTKSQPERTSLRLNNRGLLT